MNIGLLGFGAMGKAHAYSVSALPYFFHPLPFDARIGGVCCTDPKRAEQIASEYRFDRSYESAEEMIDDPHIDCISVCTPNLFHYPQLLRAIAAKKAIYCEKPLCITRQQAWEVARKAQEAGICNQVVFQNRYLAAVMHAKKIIEEGKLGRILTFRFAYLHASCTNPEKKAGWKQDKDICGGGVLFDLGSHVLDLCTHLCGEVEAISGTSQIGFPNRIGREGNAWQTNADEAFYMTLKLKNGAIGTVEANKLASGTMDEMTFSIHGQRGAIRFSLMDPHYLEFFDGSASDHMQGFVRIPCGGRHPIPGGSFPSFKAASGWLRGHVGGMYAFLAAYHEGREAAPSFSQGAYIQTLMTLAMQSDEMGGGMIPVELTEEERAICGF